MARPSNNLLLCTYILMQSYERKKDDGGKQHFYHLIQTVHMHLMCIKSNSISCHSLRTKTISFLDVTSSTHPKQHETFGPKTVSKGTSVLL